MLSFTLHHAVANTCFILWYTKKYILKNVLTGFVHTVEVNGVQQF